eukprot:CAMPEP_0205859358 /NCGR_PEP_ID=MMETSP1083-20121108/4678_1 /ASSEMBLY_ACC=CAM_ASM_000430 /TAXON_ID=97485 /ORGANISM="Prymnesium parvum, Strain Texoma1" /LENGTH=195 /DNA_ID=CAMNT_0053220959 /DNA_START=24 /DNA_END=612 /DNA_ORIENTATION=+
MAGNVGRILRATNFFEMLRLPKPYADLLEQPVWDCTDDQVNRAYRKLSLCCHPDKSSHPDAPRAFEALKKAKACLTQPLDRDDYLREFVKKAKVAWEGNWSGADTVFAEKERMSRMREDAQATQRDSIAEAMRERRERVEKEKEKERRRAEARARREAASGSVWARATGACCADPQRCEGSRSEAAEVPVGRPPA